MSRDQDFRDNQGRVEVEYHVRAGDSVRIGDRVRIDDRVRTGATWLSKQQRDYGHSHISVLMK